MKRDHYRAATILLFYIQHKMIVTKVYRPVFKDIITDRALNGVGVLWSQKFTLSPYWFCWKF